MKARRLNDVRAVVASPEFHAWWQELAASREALSNAESQRDELLAQLNLMEFRAELTQKNAIDTLYRAGEHEDRAARLLVEASQHENKSFPGVAAFEEQRFKTSEAWYALGAAERALEEARQSKLPPVEVAAAEKKHQQLEQEYEREAARKNRLWEEVEQLWARSTEVSLKHAEEQALARKVRGDAEHLFGLAEERKKRAAALKEDAERAGGAVEAARKRLGTSLAQAADLFGCAVGTDFIYFRHRDDQRRAFAVSLVDDRDHYNVEVKAQAIYSVDRQRGVGFLEPARAANPSLAEGDRRFEDYFLTGRKGEARTPGTR